MSSFVRRTTAASPRPPGGTIPSPSNPNLPVLSTGIPSLDDILGSGQPLGSTFSILARDAHSGWGKLVERYWIAQGLASGHDVVVVGGGGSDPAETEEDLRGIVKGCMWLEESAIAAKGGKNGGEEDPDSDADGLELDTGNKTRIAWRYEKMKRFQTTIGDRSSGSQVSSFSHTLNLTTPIMSALVQHLEQTQQLSYIPVTVPASSSSEPACPFAPLRNVLHRIKQVLMDKGVYDGRAPSATGQKGKSTDKGGGGKVVRIVVHELGSLDWGDRVTGPHIHRFLHSLRQLIRHSSAVVLLTYPPSLATSPPLPVASTSTHIQQMQCHPSHWLDSISHASDACITLQGFASSPSLGISFPLSHGLVHIHTLPQLHSPAPPAYKHSTLLGFAAGSGSSGQNNLAFRLKRKRFVIETLHLDVEGGVGERRTEPSSTGGAVPAARARHLRDDDGHDHLAHQHHGLGVPQAGLIVEQEGVDWLSDGDLKKSVEFAAQESEETPPDRKVRKKVAFIQHDKPELYEY